MLTQVFVLSSFLCNKAQEKEWASISFVHRKFLMYVSGESTV